MREKRLANWQGTLFFNQSKQAPDFCECFVEELVGKRVFMPKTSDDCCEEPDQLHGKNVFAGFTSTLYATPIMHILREVHGKGTFWRFGIAFYFTGLLCSGRLFHKRLVQ